MKDIELFATMPELLLVGDNGGIIYDREKFLIDGMQRTPKNEKFTKEDLISTILNDEVPELIRIN